MTSDPVISSQAEGSRFRDSAVDSGKESNTDSIGTLGSSDMAFLRIRNVPAEEVESALTARMTALGRLNGGSAEEDHDDDMKDAEGEPASDAETGKI